MTNADGSISLLAHSTGRPVVNKYVSVANAGAGALIASATVIGAWEKFDLTTPAGAPLVAVAR
ncbi:hypothetical protein [Micromonospora sp. RTGN7]|uniref:fascin domain-containing protein n=1 Tax=Micromonospora sp. RTGN7 TaxID=3016526 RepID=UPI0029FEFAC3|nr:hypothetical protein [Micromonospora sp. RTGN7]